MNLLRGFLRSVPSSRGCGCTLILKSDRDLMYSKLYCMKGTWKVLERASTRSAVAGVTGPNTPATPGRIRSHSDLLALKLSSEGYLRQQHPQKSSNIAHMSDGAPPLPLCRHEGPGQDGSVVIDRRHGAHEGRLLGAGLRVEQAR